MEKQSWRPQPGVCPCGEKIFMYPSEEGPWVVRCGPCAVKQRELVVELRRRIEEKKAAEAAAA